MINVQEVLDLHRETVARWHRQEIDNRWRGLLGVVCRQHGFNFRLWHQEDIARSPDASDSQIAEVKRTIDKLNQQRNDWIEKIDEGIRQDLAERGVAAPEGAPLSTETPGSAIDRLSILALRIHHYGEQTERLEASPEHIAVVRQKLEVCVAQQADLARSLDELIQDIQSGRRRHKTYRQLKMYNDPTLNPYLYQARRRRAG